jgi:hypothetical protein
VHWNKIKLCEHFVGKEYGIMGGSSFTFNRIDENQDNKFDDAKFWEFAIFLSSPKKFLLEAQM